MLDIVGTGGDGIGSVNISTGATVIAAAAGAKVAKHGNRSGELWVAGGARGCGGLGADSNEWDRDGRWDAKSLQREVCHCDSLQCRALAFHFIRHRSDCSATSVAQPCTALIRPCSYHPRLPLAVSSLCGSADVLEALGVAVDIGPEGVRRCIDEAGVGFMFAPAYHPAMKASRALTALLLGWCSTSAGKGWSREQACCAYSARLPTTSPAP